MRVHSNISFHSANVAMAGGSTFIIASILQIKSTPTVVGVLFERRSPDWHLKVRRLRF